MFSIRRVVSEAPAAGHGPPREADLSWTEDAPFQTFIGAVISLNSLLMGLETDFDWQGWFYIEQVLLLIYVFELGVRFKKDGWSSATSEGCLCDGALWL